MSSEAMPVETKFDLMADLCILAGQAVMREGSDDLQAAMRVVLGILGRELAARSIESGIRPSERSVSQEQKPRPRAPVRAGRLSSCA